MGSDENPGLEETPTYAVATTGFCFILVSLMVERGIHRLKKLQQKKFKYLKKKNQKPLRKVLDKMTEELMLLGFVSLLLTVLQSSVAKICVPPGFARHMLPCHRREDASEASAPEVSRVSKVGRRILYSYVAQETLDIGLRRNLMQDNITSTGHCGSQGKVPFVSREVLHELHIFIFVLAVTHVFYSFVTVCLGFARLRRWQRWEQETKVDGYDGNQDLESRYRQILESRRHFHGRNSSTFFDRQFNHPWHRNPISVWIFCFFQQFYASVSQEDYLVFRVRFMNHHGLAEPFNFWDYVIRSMQVEFQKVIGISWWLWLFVTLFLLLNAHGWDIYFWVAFLPAIIILVIGTTQQHVISTLSLQVKRHAEDVIAAQNCPESSRSNTETDFTPELSRSDKLFWFDNPQLLLKFLHFAIFQNSFELAIFFWLVTDFGWNSCLLGNHKLLLVRFFVGLLTQLLASYSTLPIYALVTQMGSKMKQTIFTKDVYKGLKQWKARAACKRQESSVPDDGQPDRTTGSAETSSEAAAPVHSSIELPVPTEEGTSEPRPREPNPELVRRFQMMYGKIQAMQKFKLASPHHDN